MIEAKVVADSVGPSGKRITTFALRYPRWILAEVNTHQIVARNSASSRATPVWKNLVEVTTRPALPVEWGANCKGMQAKALLPHHKEVIAKLLWRASSFTQAGFAWLLSKLGVHKQLTNRLVEPFMHATTLITATEWGNFFRLRAHKDAQPEFRELALAMLRAFADSNPRHLCLGQWHMPYVQQSDCDVSWGSDLTNLLLKLSTARCARVSYLNHEGKNDPDKDVALHDKLLKDGHFSPFAHCALASANPNRHSGNYFGWIQYRELKCGAHDPTEVFDPAAFLGSVAV